MKKKILAFAVIVICLALITGTTLAYFTTEDTARNVITSGRIQVEILEQQLVDGVLKPYPSQPIPVMPGATVSKIVSARSDGQPAWIRMSYTMTVLDADGKEMNIPAEEMEKVFTIVPDSQNWTLKDGWWYCGEAVSGGNTSAPLFKEVKFSGPYMDNKYQNSTLVIDVELEAVQQAHNGTTALEAVGWSAN